MVFYEPSPPAKIVNMAQNKLKYSIIEIHYIRPFTEGVIVLTASPFNSPILPVS